MALSMGSMPTPRLLLQGASHFVWWVRWNTASNLDRVKIAQQSAKVRST